MTDQPWSKLLQTWFGDTPTDSSSIQHRKSWWFSADEKRDAGLSEQFGELVDSCAQGRMYHWLKEPEGRLALVIALDQLPRNLFRGTPRAFQYDSYTTALCLAAARTGEDRKLKPIQRVFLYMPLEHFEDLQAQNAGVSLYSQLVEENPDCPAFEGFLSYARLHRDIVARFGRFPHRNRVLNRESTLDEIEYLAGDAPTFGQS
jgi:uncharacterized protein (DUF924 family)